MRHTFESVYDAHSRVLILGSFPSRISRAQGFYYANERNRFWPVLCGVLGVSVPQSVEDKKAMLLQQGIALWDMAALCEVRASADSSIRRVVPNDIKGLTQRTQIGEVFANGATAYALYCRYAARETGIAGVQLPSTSPANAAFGMDRLLAAWDTVALSLRAGDRSITHQPF